MCSGSTPENRGTAFVVYEDVYDAKNACEHLSGFNVSNRYLVVLYYQANRVSGTHNSCISCAALQVYSKLDNDSQRKKLEDLKNRYGVGLGSVEITKEDEFGRTPVRPTKTPMRY